MKRCSYSRAALIASALALPAIARADAISPILNLFTPELWLPSLVVTVLIILIESLFLRFAAKVRGYWRALGVSALVNAASSAAGSLLLAATGMDPYFYSGGKILLAFLVTLAVELPLLVWLCRRFATRTRILVAGAGMNVASYVAVIALEAALFMGALAFDQGVEGRRQKVWPKNGAVMKGQCGRLVLSGEHEWQSRGFAIYDIESASWTMRTNFPTDSAGWSVRGGLAAFTPGNGYARTNAAFAVASMDGAAPVAEWTEAELGDDSPIREAEFSPDGGKVAVLFNHGEIRIPIRESSYRILGLKQRMAILDVRTRRVMARPDMWFSGGLAWSADSREVYSTIHADPAICEEPVSDVTARKYRNAVDGDIKVRTLAINAETGKARDVVDGWFVMSSAKTGRLLLKSVSELAYMDPGGEPRKIPLERLDIRSAALSPDGESVALAVSTSVGLMYSADLRVLAFRIGDPEKIFLLKDSRDLATPIRWVEQGSATGH